MTEVSAAHCRRRGPADAVLGMERRRSMSRPSRTSASARRIDIEPIPSIAYVFLRRRGGPGCHATTFERLRRHVASDMPSHRLKSRLGVPEVPSTISNRIDEYRRSSRVYHDARPAERARSSCQRMLPSDLPRRRRSERVTTRTRPRTRGGGAGGTGCVLDELPRLSHHEKVCSGRVRPPRARSPAGRRDRPHAAMWMRTPRPDAHIPAPAVVPAAAIFAKNPRSAAAPARASIAGPERDVASLHAPDDLVPRRRFLRGRV